MKTHDGTVHKCPEKDCTYEAIDIRYLKNHMKVHTDDLPYPCKECDEAFNTSCKENVTTRTCTPNRAKLWDNDHEYTIHSGNYPSILSTMYRLHQKTGTTSINIEISPWCVYLVLYGIGYKQCYIVTLYSNLFRNYQY